VNAADTQVLHTQQKDDLWTFTLNRPQKRNALNAALVDALLAAVQQAHANQARVLVFRGAGESFSAGFDLSALETQSEGDLVLRFIRIEMLLQAVACSPAQTVALVHGKVFGAAVDLFAVCRHRIAAENATFRMPGLQFGLLLGSRRFGELVGATTARQVLERTGTFSANEALAMQFATRIAPPEDWPGQVAHIRETVSLLEDDTRSALYRTLHPDHADQDLATLTRSAARPGLKERLRRYLGQ